MRKYNWKRLSSSPKKRHVNRGTYCSVVGCERKARELGMCRKHNMLRSKNVVGEMSVCRL